MSTVVVGCDANGVHDSQVQSTIAKALEKQGHKVEKLPVKSTAFADYDWGNIGNPKGKIGVYIIAAGTNSITDAYDNKNGFKYCYFVIRGDLSVPPHNRKGFETAKIGGDADCRGNCAKAVGKTFPEMNEMFKDHCHMVFGTTADEMATELVKAMGGEVSDSKSDSKSSSGSSIKEALKQALKKWDGEAEVKLRGDTVYINRIPDPSTAKLVISEYDNIIYDSVTVTDINPGVVNTLIMNYKGYELKLTDDDLIARFGEIKKTIKPSSDIKKLSDAQSYFRREWNKIRRDDGRQVELKVPGDSKWYVGRWAQVHLPSFNINDYMYITKVSHDEDGTNNWTTNLTLVDYPPSLSTDDSEDSSSKKKSSSKSDSDSSSSESGDSS